MTSRVTRVSCLTKKRRRIKTSLCVLTALHLRSSSFPLSTPLLNLATPRITYPPRSSPDQTCTAAVPRPANLNRPWDSVPRPLLRAASLLACILPKDRALQQGGARTGSWRGMEWTKRGWCPGDPQPCSRRNLEAESADCGGDDVESPRYILHPMGPARIVKRLG